MFCSLVRVCRAGKQRSAVRLQHLDWLSCPVRSFKLFCCTRLSSVTVGLLTQTLELATGFHEVWYEPYDIGSLCVNTQSVPRSKHTVSAIKTSQLMFHREIIAVCSEIHTKHINTLCGRNVEFVKVIPRFIYRKLIFYKILGTFI